MTGSVVCSRCGRLVVDADAHYCAPLARFTWRIWAWMTDETCGEVRIP